MILGANGRPACDSRIRKSAHPDPTPAKEVYFPFFSLPPPSPLRQHQDLHRAPAGRPPPCLASPGSGRGREREGEGASRLPPEGLLGRWAERNPWLPSKVGAPGVTPPVLLHLCLAFPTFLSPPPGPPHDGREPLRPVSVRRT